MYHIDRLNIIELGVFRENNRPVEIDVGSWLDQQPDLAFEIVLRKPSANTTYLVSPMLGDRTLTWIVTEGDVAAVGYGEGQIRAYVGGTKWKTKVFKTHIYESMTGADTGDAPSESQSWVDDTAAKALKAEGFAVGKQSGSDVGSTSPYYHNNSKYYSEVAGAQASTATTKAGEAANSATDAAGSATAAAGSATAAAGSATSAANSATAAAGSATAASNSATAAESAETTALAYKDTTKTLHDNVVEMEAYTQTLQGWASQSEIAAEGYRDQCASLKDDCQALHGSVQVYHQAIGGMCDTVVAKAGEVETNAATASAKATAAAGSATSAAGSATTATNKAIEASASASTATAKATAAAGSATSAANSAAAAEGLKDSFIQIMHSNEQEVTVTVNEQGSIISGHDTTYSDVSKYTQQSSTGSISFDVVYGKRTSASTGYRIYNGCSIKIGKSNKDGFVKRVKIAVYKKSIASYQYVQDVLLYGNETEEKTIDITQITATGDLFARFEVVLVRNDNHSKGDDDSYSSDFTLIYTDLAERKRLYSEFDDYVYISTSPLWKASHDRSASVSWIPRSTKKSTISKPNGESLSLDSSSAQLGMKTTVSTGEGFLDTSSTDAQGVYLVQKDYDKVGKAYRLRTSAAVSGGATQFLPLSNFAEVGRSLYSVQVQARKALKNVSTDDDVTYIKGGN